MNMTKKYLGWALFWSLLVTLMIYAVVGIKNSKTYVLEFPNKKAGWFVLANNNKTIAELGIKNFDLFTNISNNKYSSFIVFTQGNICKVISTSLDVEQYAKFKDIPFIRQTMEIPTLSINSKDFCKSSVRSHFILKDVNDLKKITRQYKKFNNEQEVQEFIKLTKSKKSVKELLSELANYELLQMKIELQQ